MYTIENNLIKASFKLKGAELFSLIKSGKEYMHDGKNYWSYHSPILFPQVGSNELIFDSKLYIQKNHGFARLRNFKLLNHDNTSISFYLEADRETLEQYPFKFYLEVKYVLEDNKLTISYLIKNKDAKIMPFGFGLHPAFKIDMGKAYIEFEVSEELKEINNHSLKLNYELFAKYKTILFKEPKSKFLYLNDDNRKIKITFDNFKYLALWKPLASDFVCIEPWLAYPRNLSGVEYKNFPDIINLAENKEYQLSYQIEIIN